jgi:hypothetical protein
MAHYFVEPYTSYYSLLRSSSGMEKAASVILNELSNSKKMLSSLSAEISNSRWNESGLQELSQNVLPNLGRKFETIYYNVNSSLYEVVTKSIYELFPMLGNLKTEDNNYEESLDLLQSLVSVSSDDEGYQDYLEKKT